MNSRFRRISTTGMLLLAALSLGCGADGPSTQEPAKDPEVAPPNARVAAPESAKDFAPLGGTRTAGVIGRGTVDDGATVRNLADGLYGALSTGALAALSPARGAIGDAPERPLMVATIPSTPEGVTASDALLPKLALTAVARLVLASLLGLRDVRMTDAGLIVRDPDGTALTIRGITASPGAIPEKVQLSSAIQIAGTLVEGGHPEAVDVWIRGLSGSIGRTPASCELAFSPAGVRLMGQVGSRLGDATITGLTGSYSGFTKLSQALATGELKVHVSRFAAVGAVRDMSMDLTILRPSLGDLSGRPSAEGIWGTLDAHLDPEWTPTARGRITHLSAQILRSSALVFDADHDRPLSGAIQASVHFARSGHRDDLSLTFVGGQPILTGTLANATGAEERIAGDAETLRSSGTVTFADGRRSDHEIEVARNGSDREVAFSVKMAGAAGPLLVSLAGRSKEDRSATGTWSRPGGATGTFQLSPAGALTLANAGGEPVAVAVLPQGWDVGL